MLSINKKRWKILTNGKTFRVKKKHWIRWRFETISVKSIFKDGNDCTIWLTHQREFTSIEDAQKYILECELESDLYRDFYSWKEV